MEEDIKQKIIEAYNSDKLDISNLAEKLYMTKKQVKMLLSSWGVEATKKRKKIEIPSRDELMHLYHELGNTTNVGKHYGIGSNKVSRWMKTLNIPTVKLVMSEEEKIKILEKHVSSMRNIDF